MKFFVQKTIRKVLNGQILWTIKNGVRHTVGDIEKAIFRLIASKNYITPSFFPIPLFNLDFYSNLLLLGSAEEKTRTSTPFRTHEPESPKSPQKYYLILYFQ